VLERGDTNREGEREREREREEGRRERRTKKQRIVPLARTENRKTITD